MLAETRRKTSKKRLDFLLKLNVKNYEMLGIVDNEDNVHKIFVPFNNGELIEGFDRIFHHAVLPYFLF